MLELHQAQKLIAQSSKRFIVANCGRKFGKTFYASYDMAAKAFSKNDIQIAYIAPNYGEARDIMWSPLKRITRPIWKGEPNESRLEIKVKTQDGGESIIFLKGWEAVENLRGMEFDYLVLDEVAKYKGFWESWHEVLRPTLTPRQGSALFISTPRGYNHFYDLYNLSKTDKDYQSFHFTSYDNPNLNKEEIEKAKQELPEDRFAQEYLADFRKTEGLVYKEFNREAHIVKVVPQYRTERILGIDFGYTNPAAVLVIDKDLEGNYWITDEWYRTGKTNIEIIEYCKSKQSNAVYPDPAEPDRIEEMRRHGLNIREVSKDIEAGISKVRELFKANKIKIHESCHNLITELESYRYPDRKPEHNEPETPIKENDHAVDALRYVMMSNSDTTQSKASTYVPKPYLNLNPSRGIIK